MNFEFSAEQEHLRDQVRRLLSEEKALGLTRSVLEGGPLPHALWKVVTNVGWLGVGVPEEYGGSGMGVVELCVIAEEMGRVAASLPFLSARGLAIEAILRTGDEACKSQWLPPLVSGERIGCFVDVDAGLSVHAGRVSGCAGMVLDADWADCAVVAALNEQRHAELALVMLDQPGVTREPVQIVDPGHPYSRLTFSGARGIALAAGPAVASALAAARNTAVVLAAFEQLGGADRCLEMARDYALQRRAFGRLIGSYQAIKHKLVDVYVGNTLARGHAYMGACAIEHRAADTDLAVASARASCTEAFDTASQENIQVHGGIGFTWEHDCHLYYRRARTLALALGPLPLWKDRIVSALERRLAD